MKEKAVHINTGGNERFFGIPPKQLNPQTKENVFTTSGAKGFGKLGSGILRPQRNPFGISIKPVQLPKEKFASKMSLSDEDRAKQIADHITDSLQKRIDEATANKIKEAKEGKEKAEEEGSFAGQIALYITGGLLTIGLGYLLLKKFNIINTKAD